MATVELNVAEFADTFHLYKSLSSLFFVCEFCCVGELMQFMIFIDVCSFYFFFQIICSEVDYVVYLNSFCEIIFSMDRLSDIIALLRTWVRPLLLFHGQ